MRVQFIAAFPEPWLGVHGYLAQCLHLTHRFIWKMCTVPKGVEARRVRELFSRLLDTPSIFSSRIRLSTYGQS